MDFLHTGGAGCATASHCPGQSANAYALEFAIVRIPTYLHYNFPDWLIQLITTHVTKSTSLSAVVSYSITLIG